MDISDLYQGPVRALQPRSDVFHADIVNNKNKEPNKIPASSIDEWNSSGQFNRGSVKFLSLLSQENDFSEIPEIARMLVIDL